MDIPQYIFEDVSSEVSIEYARISDNPPFPNPIHSGTAALLAADMGYRC